MSQAVSQTTAGVPRRALPNGNRLNLAGRLTAIVLVSFVEKFFLNFFVNFDGPRSTTALGELVNATQLLGLRFALSLAVCIALFGHVAGGQQLRQLNAAARSAHLRPRWLLLHALFVACIAPLLWYLDGLRGEILPLSVQAACLGLLGVAAPMTLFLALAPWGMWAQAIRALGVLWVYAILVALTATGLLYWTQELWDPTARVTFELVRRILSPVIPSLQGDPSTRIISTERFSVSVSDICSGLEGVGLMLAFCCGWLLCFRREYRFPQALVLIPAGLALIFALNVVRIAALVLIGDSGYPEIAQYGFHSQAGWIAFNVAACAIAVASRNVAWLNRAVASNDEGNTDNPVAVYLIPLLAVLAAGILTRIFSVGFDAWAPMRLAAGAGALLLYRRQLAILDWRCSWRGAAVGLLVFVIWILAARLALQHSPMPAALAAWPDWERHGWITARVATIALIVPIVEELAYRGYLMRRLQTADFEGASFRSVGLWPLIISSVVFGLGHGAMWHAGIAAGVIYGMLVIRTGRLGEAVVAHATTNLLLASCALTLNWWELW